MSDATAIDRLLNRYPTLALCRREIESLVLALTTCFRDGGQLLVCGNGGSAADSEHLVAELMKGYGHTRPVPSSVRDALLTAAPGHGGYLADHLQGALPAISLASQIALATATANDIAADMVFAQQVYGYGRPGDALLALSTSGESVNVLHAARVARARGLSVLGITGRAGGTLTALCDVAVSVPADGASDVQELALPIYHALCAALESTFFPRVGRNSM